MRDLGSMYRALAGDLKGQPRLDDLERQLDNLERVYDKLRYHNRRRKTVYDHTLMQLVLAKYLIKEGWDVRVEYDGHTPFVCDVKAFKRSGGKEESLNIEIETNFWPQYKRHMKRPKDIYLLYEMKSHLKARVVSKAARYSGLSTRFAFGIQPDYALIIPKELFAPPERREARVVREYKELCDAYSKQETTEERISKAKIDSIFVIDLAGMSVEAKSPAEYFSDHSISQ